MTNTGNDDLLPFGDANDAWRLFTEEALEFMENEIEEMAEKFPQVNSVWEDVPDKAYVARVWYIFDSYTNTGSPVLNGPVHSQIDMNWILILARPKSINHARRHMDYLFKLGLMEEIEKTEEELEREFPPDDKSLDSDIHFDDV